MLLKINAKLGGINSLLAMEQSPSMPLISKFPTMILGIDVSHRSPGQSDIPSIAAVVGSRKWSLISCYRASVRTQTPKVEMIDSFFKRVSDTVDEGIIRELLLDFYASSGKRKPDQIIIFRDGVSESQFNQVLNIELDQIIEACNFLDELWCPKFTVIVAQKNHHTKFFQKGSPDDVPSGTVIDKQICHSQNNDFYMCSHAGMIGTTWCTLYHVLFDEAWFSSEDLEGPVHSSSYVYQRGTAAMSKDLAQRKHGVTVMGGLLGGSRTLSRSLIKGLPNYGNTCYINAVLQIVANLPRSCHGLHRPCGQKDCSTCLLHTFLLRYRRGMPLKLDELTEKSHKFGDFKKNSPDGTFEFYSAIVDKLDAQSFKIAHKIQYECLECEIVFEEDEVNVECYYIGLDASSGNVPKSVASFFNEIEDRFCPYCQRRVKKSLKVVSLPIVLALLVGQDAEFEFEKSKKVSSKYKFDVSLKLNDYLEDSEYDLYGVIVHWGDEMKNGHWVSYIKVNDEWFECNDSVISKVNQQEVLQQEPHMIFYTKVKTFLNLEEENEEERKWLTPLWWIICRCCGNFD